MKKEYNLFQTEILWANARFEMLTLLRGWFFRIFSGVVIVLFTFFDVILFTRVAPMVPRVFYGLSAALPYSNMLILNLAQIAVVVLIASDMFKRDKKINTSEVFYIRSMTNATLVFGKALGIFIVFIGFDILLLLVCATIHLVFGETNFTIAPYYIYLMLIVIPSFIFTMGLTFFLTRLIRNQAAIVFIILGYFAAVLFYLRNLENFFFDFPAMNLPLFYSDFTGIANLELVLAQRGFYLITGFLLIFITILIFTRLPQSQILKKILLGFTTVFILASVFLAVFYLQTNRNTILHRQQMSVINQQFIEKKNISVSKYRIDLDHQGNHIQAAVWIDLFNPNDMPLDSMYFSLNPGLLVNEVRSAGRVIEFQQKRHLLLIKPVVPLAPGQIDSLQIKYSGVIDEAVAYLDIPQETLQTPYMLWLFQNAKKFAFIQSQYVLLTSECLWYPIAGLPADLHHLEQQVPAFSTYELTVKTDDDLTVISQGQALVQEPGVTIFKPEKPMVKLSLVIGPYERRSITVDSTVINLYIHPQHTYFDEFFTEISDTLPAILRESIQDYEVKSGITYPFAQLSVVETPIPFFTFPRVFSTARDFMQPEQVWIPENGVLTAFADFRQLNNYFDRRIDHSNQTLTPQETQTNLFKQFVYNTFLGESSFRRRMGRPEIAFQPDFNLFPNFFTFANYVTAPNWPIFNAALEAYLYDRVAVKSNDAMEALYSKGLTRDEEVSQLLGQKSLSDLLHAEDKFDILPDVIRAKGAYLFKLLQTRQDKTSFDTRLNRVIRENIFHRVPIKRFLDEINSSDGSDFQDIISEWYQNIAMPGFLISDVEMFKVVDANRMRYQILFKISNPEKTPGLIEVQFEYGFDRRMVTGPMTREAPGQVIYMAAEQSKEIGILLESEPRSVNINTLVSLNIPLIHSVQFENAEIRTNVTPFHGERTISHPLVQSFKNEYIVDNPDEGFQFVNQPFQSVLKRLIHADKPENDAIYQQFTWWRPANQWSLIKSPSFYGEYIHSARYIRSGSGNRQVSWSKELPEDGLYDVYAYMFDKQAFWRRHRHGGSGDDTFDDFTYIIYHSVGHDQITLDAGRASSGWNFLGTFFFNKGVAKIELTDQSKGQSVVADAVKWVKN